jgi:hypothetical protein
MNALNTVIANAIEKSKLGEAGFVKHDIFSSPALVEKICSDDILSPICHNSYDACAPHPFKIPMKIVERAMNNCYLGNGTVHRGDHLLFIHELCELFKCAGISMNQVKRKLFSLSLKGRAAEWYKTLKDDQPIDWEEIIPLFYSKFYLSSEVYKDRNYIYNFYPHEGESIVQAWGRLKSLMLSCPIHELPRNIVINNFYARLSGYYKDYLDACFGGTFTSKDVDAKWNLLETIQSNIKDWDSNKGKGSGINYEYDCIKSFAKTANFQELSVKCELDPRIMVDFFRAFASHINVPKGNGNVYHEPFKDTCIECDIVIDDCNKHAQTSKSTTSYKHVNFCGVLRPCEQSHNKEDYCIHHRNEKTRMWDKALDELGKKVCELYPFICELCDDKGHFNFQCSGHNSDPSNRMSTISLYCDDKITLN